MAEILRQVNVSQLEEIEPIGVVYGSAVPISLEIMDYAIPSGTSISVFAKYLENNATYANKSTITITSISKPSTHSKITFTPDEGLFNVGFNILQVKIGSIRTFHIKTNCQSALDVGGAIDPVQFETIADKIHKDITTVNAVAQKLPDWLDQVDDNTERIETLENGGYQLSQSFLKDEIADWLTKHPDATSTVQDGSLTFPKVAPGGLGFVCPQMFTGDEYDTWDEKFQAAFNYAIQEKVKMYVPKGEYRLIEHHLIEGRAPIGESAPLDNITIEFAKDAVISTSNDNFVTFDCQNLNNVTITGGIFARDGLQSDIPRTGASGKGLWKFTNVMNTTLVDSVVTDCFTGNSFYFGTGCKSVTAERMQLHNQGSGGIVSFNSNHIRMTVRDSSFEHCKVPALTGGAEDSDRWYTYSICVSYSSPYENVKQVAESLIVDNCTFFDCDWEGPDSHGAKLVQFSNCTMHNCGRWFMNYLDGRVKIQERNESKTENQGYHHNFILENCNMYNDDDYTLPGESDYAIDDNQNYTPSFKASPYYKYFTNVGGSVNVYGHFGRIMDNVSIRNVTMINPHSTTSNYCTEFSLIDNLTIDNLKIIGGERTKYMKNPLGGMYGIRFMNIFHSNINNVFIRDIIRRSGINCVILAYWSQLNFNSCDFGNSIYDVPAVYCYTLNRIVAHNCVGDVVQLGNHTWFSAQDSVKLNSGISVLQDALNSNTYSGLRPYGSVPSAWDTAIGYGKQVNRVNYLLLPGYVDTDNSIVVELPGSVQIPFLLGQEIYCRCQNTELVTDPDNPSAKILKCTDKGTDFNFSTVIKDIQILCYGWEKQIGSTVIDKVKIRIIPTTDISAYSGETIRFSYNPYRPKSDDIYDIRQIEPIQTRTTKDLNEYTTPGVYYIVSSTGDTTNLPPNWSTTGNYKLEVQYGVRTDKNVQILYYFNADAPKVAFRLRGGNGWGAWKVFTLT